MDQKIVKKDFKKKLIAKHSPQNQCFAKDGEELVVADPQNQKEKEGDWYFVGVKTGRKSKFAWISNSEEFSLEDIIKKINLKEPSERYVVMLYKCYEKISGLEEGSSIACGWSEYGLLEKRLEFDIYKVFFYER